MVGANIRQSLRTKKSAWPRSPLRDVKPLWWGSKKYLGHHGWHAASMMDMIPSKPPHNVKHLWRFITIPIKCPNPPHTIHLTYCMTYHAFYWCSIIEDLQLVRAWGLPRNPACANTYRASCMDANQQTVQWSHLVWQVNRLMSNLISSCFCKLSAAQSK